MELVLQYVLPLSPLALEVVSYALTVAAKIMKAFAQHAPHARPQAQSYARMDPVPTQSGHVLNLSLVTGPCARAAFASAMPRSALPR